MKALPCALLVCSMTNASSIILAADGPTSLKSFCTIADVALGFGSAMNFRFAPLLPIAAFVWLSSS